MDSIIDPQHQAVRSAAADLKANRYWSRDQRQQHTYLEDVEDLAREFAFILNQAGISWDEIVGALDSQQGTTARLLQLDPSGRTELALCTGVAQRRAES